MFQEILDVIHISPSTWLTTREKTFYNTRMKPRCQCNLLLPQSKYKQKSVWIQSFTEQTGEKQSLRRYKVNGHHFWQAKISSLGKCYYVCPSNKIFLKYPQFEIIGLIMGLSMWLLLLIHVAVGINHPRTENRTTKMTQSTDHLRTKKA